MFDFCQILFVLGYYCGKYSPKLMFHQSMKIAIALFIAKRLHVSRRCDLETTDIELLWCEIKLQYKKFLFGVVFRPLN